MTDANGCIYPANGDFISVDVAEPNQLLLSLTRYQYAQQDKDGANTSLVIGKDGYLNGELEFNIRGGLKSNGKYNYQIVLTGANGGSNYTSVKRPEPKLDATTGDEVGNDYVWYANTATASDDDEFLNWSVLTLGDYTLTVTDLNSVEHCKTSKTFTISALELTESIEQPTCSSSEGDGVITIDVTGNSGRLSYEWYQLDGNGVWANLTNFSGYKVVNALKAWQL